MAKTVKYLKLAKGSNVIERSWAHYKKNQQHYTNDRYFPIIDQELPDWLNPETKPTNKEETTSAKSTKKKEKTVVTENTTDGAEPKQDSEN